LVFGKPSEDFMACLVRCPTVDGGSDQSMGRVGAKKFGAALPHRVVGVHLFQQPAEPLSAEIYAPQLRSDSNQKTVLVGEVQLMERPETVIPSIFPAFLASYSETLSKIGNSEW
jgi:hypothetical protein